MASVSPPPMVRLAKRNSVNVSSYDALRFRNES
jgi:hypothetical protein